MGNNKKRNIIFLAMLWIIQGIVVGFAAIVPGLSGGALLAAFGMHRPIVELMSDIKNIKSSLKKYGLMFALLIVGVGIGFVGLSGFTHMLMGKNKDLVISVFVGFVLGTVPDLWKTAGEDGRGKKSYISLTVAFAVMMVVLGLLKTKLTLSVTQNFWGFGLCGIFWALSFIVPGLSSSTLIEYIQLYDPMLEGISTFNFSVLIPMGLGFVVCILLLAKAVGIAYKKQFAVVSHAVLGVVVATALMIYPLYDIEGQTEISFKVTLIKLLFVIGGAILSLFFTHICNKIKEKTNN